MIWDYYNRHKTFDTRKQAEQFAASIRHLSPMITAHAGGFAVDWYE